MEKTKIDSLKALAQHLSWIVERLSASPQLALAAAHNPVETIESLGFDLSTRARREVERTLLSKPERTIKLAHLSKSLSLLGDHATGEAGIILHQELYDELKATFEEAQRHRLEDSGPPLPRRRDKKVLDKLTLADRLQERSCVETFSPQLSDLQFYRHLRNEELPALNRENGSEISRTKG